MSSSWTMHRFTKKKFYRTLQENTRRPWFFLPSYSPEHNPLEHSWSALKRKVCWLCSEIWLPFTGSECVFTRQVAMEYTAFFVCRNVDHHQDSRCLSSLFCISDSSINPAMQNDFWVEMNYLSTPPSPPRQAKPRTALKCLAYQLCLSLPSRLKVNFVPAFW